MGEHKYALRVPQALWDELKVAASRNRRSINSEILWRLGLPGAPFDQPGPDGPSLAEGGLPRRRFPSARVEEGGRPDAVAVGASQSGESDPRPVREPDRSFRPDFKGGKK